MWHVFGRICFPLRCCSSSILGKRPHPGDSAPEVSQALQHIARPRPAEDETCQPLQVKSDSDLDERSVIAKPRGEDADISGLDRKSTRLNSSHLVISYAVFCLKKKKKSIEGTSHTIKEQR